MRRTRINRDLEEIERNDTDGLFAYQDPSDLDHIIAVVKGPADSPFESGYFKLDIKCPHDYPFKACQIKFLTEVWHPNVMPETGAISSAVLCDDWSPAYNLLKCFITIQCMLYVPVVTEPTGAANFAAATTFVGGKESYNQTARFWTEVHALNAPPTEEQVAEWFALKSRVAPSSHPSQSTSPPASSSSSLLASPRPPSRDDSLPASALLLPVEFTKGRLLSRRQQTPTRDSIFGNGTGTSPGTLPSAAPAPSPAAEMMVLRLQANGFARAGPPVQDSNTNNVASITSPLATLNIPRTAASPVSPVSAETATLLSPPTPLTPPAPPSWLAQLLEGRTTPAFIALCEQKLIQQEDFSSAALLAMVPESDFTCAYLDKIGITARGLKIKLMVLHRELRASRLAAEDSTQAALCAATAKIGALEAENANLKAQLEERQVENVSLAVASDGYDTHNEFVHVD